MTNDKPTHYRFRFEVTNAPAGRRNQDREGMLPIFDGLGGFTGLVQEMWYISDAKAGATIVQTDGDYVRTWTLLEVIR